MQNNAVSGLQQNKNFQKNITKNACLVFKDGTTFYGFGIGVLGTVFGEICFNTSITGYQEILTDPSYAGQIITFTFPHIGNVGTNLSDIEGKKTMAKGLIINQPITNPSNYRSQQHLNTWLISQNLTGISGIDTRAITQKIRQEKASTVSICYTENLSDAVISQIVSQLQQATDLTNTELALQASQKTTYQWKQEGAWLQNNNQYQAINSTKYKVVAIDYGAKLNILRCLTQLNCEVVVVSANASFAEIMSHNPSGVFLSNGPGDPQATAEYALPVIQEVLKNNIPLFGICLGHQLLALATGAKTTKMAQGHRGANHPVKNLKNNKVEITSQNHGFCVDTSSLPSNVKISHISLFDNTIEGIELINKPAFSVQYHPESSPGPSDSFYLFEQFIELMQQHSKAKVN
ncbi:MAG: carbamoyl-phosphate synthase small subunit [Proteobacteria bacterium]|nr:carbamoyl-phosphate synthase small subunit [Pseudomonadota bacterium]